MKKIRLLSIVMFYAMAAYAQLPVTNWQNTFGNSSGNARVTSTATDASGNVYVAGYFFGSVDMDFGAGQANITSSGQYDAFIAKYNAFGDFIWVRRVGGTQGDQVNALFLDNSGGLHVTGFFQGTTSIFASNGTFNLTSAGNADIFMLYFDGAGSLIRNFRIGSTGDESGLAIKADLNSNVYLVGTIGSANVNFNLFSGSQLMSSSGALDGFIAKYDFSYGIQWVQRVGGGSTDDAINDLDVDASGNAYVVGTYRGAATFSGTSITLANSGNTDAFISKLNGSGTFLWARKVGSTGADAINNIRLNGKGSAYIAGHFSNACNLNPNGTAQNFTSLGSTDIFVAKVDTNLATATWVKPMGGTGNDLLYGMTIDTNDNVYATGQFENTAEFPIGISASLLTSAGTTDGFVSKLNTLGNYVWSTRFGTSSGDLGWDIEVSKNGNSVIVGGNQGTNAYFTQLGACNLAGPITGLTNVCNTKSITYSIAAVTGAISYVWTLPSGWSGTSTTNSITVTPAANGGTISVAPVTSCGVGVAQTRTIVYGLNTIDVNLVRHWIADNADNNRDRINNFSLTLNNTVKDTDRFATPNAAYRISGSTGFIGTGTNLPTGNTSIAFWYYYQKNGGTNNIILGSNIATVPAGHPLLLTDNNNDRLFPWSNTGGVIGSGIVFTPNTWHHIALARNGSNFTLYLNGSQVATGTNLATSNFDRIGNNRPGFETQGATGKFDEIRIYNVQLNASQVQNIYNFGQVRRLNISQPTCAGSTRSFSVNFSATGANYQWFKNTSSVGTNSPTYPNTSVLGDTLISVRIENQCITENYQYAYQVSNPVTNNLTETACGSFAVGTKRYYRSGAYKDTLKTTAGCDSIINLTLTIDNSTAIKGTDNLIHYFTLNISDTLNKADTLVDMIGGNNLFHASGRDYQNDRNGNANASIRLQQYPLIFKNSIPKSNTTISFWYYYNNSSMIDNVLLSGTNTGNTIFLAINTSGELYSSNNAVAITKHTSPLQNLTWYHLSMAFDASNNATVYFNGEQVYTITGLNASNISAIGGRITYQNTGVGQYDDIRVYNKILSAAEIRQVFRRPGLLNWKQANKFCVGGNLNYTYSVNDTNETLFEVYRNNTLVSTNLTGAFNNLTIADTSITIRVFNNCMIESYTTKLNVNRQRDTIIANTCGSYSFNNKSYTTSGLFYDTIQHSATCTTYYALYVNINDTFAPLVSSNGLIRFWSANATDFNRDITRDDTLSFIGTGITYTNGRTNAANNALIMNNTTSIIRTNIPPMSTGSISFWYRHTASNTFKCLVGSNTNNIPAGHPTMLVNSNSFRVVTNTGVERAIQNFANNTWYHIVLTRYGSDYKLYLNGLLVLQGNDLASSNFDRIGNNRPGSETQGATGGSFDDIFIYNRELSAQEVQILNNATSLLAVQKSVSNCLGSNASVNLQFSNATGASYTTWRGNTKIADTSNATISSVVISDTSSLKVRALRNCNAVEYVVGLKVNNQSLNLNNGLLCFWSMKNTDDRKSLTNGITQFSLSTTDFGSNTTGRNNLDVNGALNIPNKDNQWINTDLGTELQNNQPYTVSFWHSSLFNNQVTTDGYLISNSNVSSVAPVILNINNQVQALNNAGTAIYTAPTGLVYGTYTHITYANDGVGNYKLFINGNLVSSGSGAPTWRPERIGNGRPGLTNRGARGGYDEIAIYNRVISDAEANELFKMPAIINTPMRVITCNGNQTRLAWDFAPSTTAKYTYLKNAQVAGVDSTGLIFTPTVTDTLVGINISNGCANIQLQTQISKNITNLNNGLERFWTMNATDAEKTLAALSIGGVIKFTRSEISNMPYATGRSGAGQSAISFNTKSPYINMGIAGLTNITVSFWHRPNATIAPEGVRALIGTNSSSILNIDVSSGNLNMRAIGTSGSYIGSGYTLTAGAWHHIVFIRNGSDYQIYVNDTLRLSGTGINQSQIQYIGNSANFTFGAPGTYDDIAVYSRAVSRDEVASLFLLPTIINIPDTAVLCAGASRNFAFAFSSGNAGRYRLVKSVAPSFTQTIDLNANGTSGTTTAAAGDRIAVIQTVGCSQMQYNFYPNVQGTSSAGPTLTYNPVTRNVSVTSTFNSVKLFRNGLMVVNNTTSGNLNYNSPFRCGNYYAEYVNTGSSCPSISPTLNALPIDTFNRSASLCAGNILNFGSLNITNPGMYIQTFTGVVGNCDSTVRLTVIVGQASTSNISRTGCGSLTIFGNTYTQSGQYKDTLINAAGCDSIVTLNLTINSGGPAVNNIVQSACNNFVLNGKTYTNTGIYRDTLFGASATGCDSILVLNLTIQKNGSTQNISACKSYVIKGVTITQSGTYRDTLTNTAGCDSIIVYNLNITTVNKTVTKTGNTLTAAAANANYLWINCTTNLPIANANMQSYTPTVSGSYKVIITQNGCIDTSACTNVTIINCNLQLTHNILNPTDTTRCKQVKVSITNGALPIALKLTWSTNTIGTNLNITDSVHTFTNACPETYKLVATDNNGCKDSINFTINEPTIGVNDINANPFSMYPNPANKILIINNLSKESQINIFDITGRIIYSEIILTSSIELDIENWKDGIYTVQVITEGKFANRKLVIAK